MEELARLEEDRLKKKHWRKWGPYLSERQWGTVREDYSANGKPWEYFPFDHAASRAYRWGEDGIGGFCDNHGRICFSFAFWNEKDPILKERLFGLANHEGNHGEDVKECYYYLDATPTHSYQRFLYKYPFDPYPYEDLKIKNRERSLADSEYELADTGIFQNNRYFDCFIEMAKGDEEDLLIRLTVENRSNEAKKIHVLPQVWFRNVWSWWKKDPPGSIAKEDHQLKITYPDFDDRWLLFEGDPKALFTENETNFEKLYQKPNRTRFVKDAFHEYVIHQKQEAVNQEKGTKAALHHVLEIPANGKQILRYRFTNKTEGFANFDELIGMRKNEADQFYQSFSKNLNDDQKSIQRQAFSSLLWSRQFYHYVVEEWLKGDDPENPPPEERKKGRNSRWFHVYNDDILSMPDKWEYPWFASWDLVFHCIPMVLLDPEFAKRQLTLLTREWYMHPNGHLPSYEWDFENVNPPVLAWGALRIFKDEGEFFQRSDRLFLESIFQKLLINFTWWVNRHDAEGRNVFEGGFLGLDNISVFNRNDQLPEGASLTQSDATSWMGMFCLNMWLISLELAVDEPSYEDMASRFFEHFLFIADAINFEHPDSMALWDEEDGFYYDLLKSNGGQKHLKVRSAVGLIPLFAVAVFEEAVLQKLEGFNKRFQWFLAHRSDLCGKVACMKTPGFENRRILSILNQDRLMRILDKMLDENEFLSPYGIRSVSKFHQEHPFVLECNGESSKVDYEPGLSQSSLFGGNSNWRGPIWLPLNYLIIESLERYHSYYGDGFKVEFPTGSGHLLNLKEIADELSRRLMGLFEKDSTGRRPAFGECDLFQKDPHFSSHLLFHEFFHGERGEGLGASHQTGWTSLIAKLYHKK